MIFNINYIYNIFLCLIFGATYIFLDVSYLLREREPLSLYVLNYQEKEKRRLAGIPWAYYNKVKLGTES